MASKKDNIAFCKAYEKTLLGYRKLFNYLGDKDISTSHDEDSNCESIARIADKYGFNGNIYRNTIPYESPLSLEAGRNTTAQIETIPRIIAAIEQYKEPVTIPDDAELLSIRQIALLLGWGESVVRQRDREGVLPKPIRFKGTIQWKRKELNNWLAVDCPARQKWEQIKQEKGT